MTAPAAAKKNKWGVRVYPVPVPGTDEVVELTSVSKMLEVLSSRQLDIWKQKTIATAFSQNPHLVMMAASDPYGAAKQALDLSQSRAITGTAIHKFTEGVDDGTLIYDMVPAPAKPWVDTYLKAKDYFKWESVYQEQTVFNHALGYGGTADRFLRFPDGEIAKLLVVDPTAVMVGDIKTGADVWPNQALQMFFYVHGEGIWIAPSEDDLVQFNAATKELDKWIATGTNIPEGRRKWSEDAVKVARAELDELKWKEYAGLGKFLPMPEGLNKKTAFILHLHENDFELVPMDLSAAQEVVESICHIYKWNERTSKGIIGTRVQLPPPPPPIAPALQDQVDALRKRANALPKDKMKALAAKWPRGVPALKTGPFQDDEVGRADLAAIGGLIDELEALVQAEQETLAVVQEVFPGAEVTETTESN